MDKSILLLIAFALCGLVLVSAHRNPEEDSEKELEDCDCSLEWFEDKDTSIGDELLIEAYRKCKSKLDSEIKRLVDSFSGEVREKIEFLTTDSIDASEEGENYFVYEKLENATEKFARKLISQLEPVASPSQRVKVEVSTKIVPKIRDVCVETKRKLQTIIQIFDILEDRDEFKENIYDKFTQEWLTRGRACEKILGSADFIGNAAEKAFIANYLENHDEERKLLDEWNELKKKVFDPYNEEKHSPEEMMNHIKRSGEIFTALNRRGLIAKGEQWGGLRLEKINRLRNLNAAHCFVTIFKEIRQAAFQEYFPDLSKSSIAYLDNIGKRQYRICMPQFERELDRAISRLTGEHLKDIKQFSGDGLDSSANRIFSKQPSDFYISKGALNILKSRGAKLSKKISFNELDKLLLKHVSDLCRNVKTALKDVVESHHKIVAIVNADDLIGQKTSDWLYRYGMCDTFEKNRERIIRGIQEILSEQQEDGKKLFGLF